MQKSHQSVNVVRTVSGHYPKCFQPIQEFSTPWLLEHPTPFQEHCQTKLLEIGRATLQRCLMIKHSPFSFMKPGPGLLNHLA